jgi:hypothetical protein
MQVTKIETRCAMNKDCSRVGAQYLATAATGVYRERSPLALGPWMPWTQADLSGVNRGCVQKMHQLHGM